MRRFVTWWTFERLVQLLLVLNLIDGASTHVLLHLYGPELELNPLMRWAWTTDPLMFWALKIFLVCGGLMALAKYTSESLARSVALSANALYLIAMLTHIHGWIEHCTN